MHWFRSLIFLTTGCFLAHGSEIYQYPTCLFADDLRETWKELEKLSTAGLFEDCPLIDKSNLCAPAQILEMVRCQAATNIMFSSRYSEYHFGWKVFSSSTEAAIVEILNEIAKLFVKEGIPFHNVRNFHIYISARHHQVKRCLLQSQLILPVDDSISECFQMLHELLSQGDNRCAWQVVYMETMVILQQLEYQLNKKALQESTSVNL